MGTWREQSRERNLVWSLPGFVLSLLPFATQLGEHHEKTKESSEYLKYLTQQAVALQRTMNEIYKNGSNANIMPLKVTSAQEQRSRALC